MLWVVYFHMFIITRVTCVAVCAVFFVQPIKISIGGALIFKIHLGIHPSKTGEKLVYYLYDEKSSFPMGVFTLPLNRPFIIFILTKYLPI